MKGKTKDGCRAAILVLPGARRVDCASPLDVLDRVATYSCVVVRAGAQLTQPVDTLLITSTSSQTTELGSAVRWLRHVVPSVRRIGAMSTGVFPLAEAGILDGRQATTDWRRCEELARLYPRVRVQPDAMLVRDGNVYTAAGITAGLYLALALVEQDHGYDLAVKLARELEMPVRQPVQPPVSAAPQRVASTVPMRQLQQWLASHLQERLEVKRLAAMAGMSSRHFAREFVRDLGRTPAKYVEEVRVEAVRRLLERSTYRLDQIAPLCGFRSADSMRRAFLRTLHITPATYRDQFRKISPGTQE